jgi:hypothetical protein
MKNKLLTAQHIFSNADGQFSSGFNCGVYGETISCTQGAGIDFFRGWSKAQDMILDGKIFYIHNFHTKECDRNDSFIYGGFWVCNGCGKKKIDKSWWTIKVVRDGSEFCCIGENFTNIQESDNFAFGKTKKEAIDNYSDMYK